jgi:hypothetical protein
VKDNLVSLYEFYLKADEVVEDNRHTQDVDDVIDDLQEEDNVENRNKVERYLINGCEDPNDDKLDILCWWKINASKYKILSKVAKYVLAISISTVASESAFSTGGRILDQFRSSLSPATVQALICCQNWLHHGPIPTDDGTLINDFETYENLEGGNFSYKLTHFIV